MAWTLEIHHIDVDQGDATLIVAREVPPLVGANPIVRAALIDGGRQNQGQTVHNYITARVNQLDVMIATHYDGDHRGGLIHLLTSYAGTYNNTFIFDPGWTLNLNNNLITYLRAINGFNQNGLAAVFAQPGVAPLARVRVTNHILSDGQLPNNIIFGGAVPAAGTFAVPLGAPGAINGNPWWLVNQEILWWGLAGPGTALPPGIPAPGNPGHPPRIVCIAANGHVLQAGGNTQFLGQPGGMPFDANAKSLAFLVEFNNFKYYIGGDIETTQEDGDGNNNGIMHLLNPNNNLAGRVHAMKTSHHGSANSTSRAFVNRLRPIAAFISCGFNNQFNHPRQEVVNVLEGYGQNDYLANLNNPAQPHAQPNPANPALPNPPIGLGWTPHHEVENYYLTNARGYQNNFIGSGADIVSGALLLGGHIVIHVNEAQALGQVQINNNLNNFNVTYNHPPIGINGNNQTTNNH